MNWQQNTFQIRPGGITPVVRALIIANVAVFILEWLFGSRFVDIFGLSIAGIKHGYFWQFFTYMFLHSRTFIFHIIFNMLVLFFMGPETERGMGSRHFLAVYLLSGVLGGVAWIMIGSPQACIGASGAVFGILGAFAALYPHQRITLLVFFVLPVTMKAWIMVAGLALLQLIMFLGETGGGVAYSVHVGGVIVGVLYTWVIFKDKIPGNFTWPRKIKPRLRVVRGGKAAPAPPVSQQEIDQVLDKIANKGMGSLTRHERTILEQASRDRRDRML